MDVSAVTGRMCPSSGDLLTPRRGSENALRFFCVLSGIQNYANKQTPFAPTSPTLRLRGSS